MSTGGSESLSAPGREGNYSPVMASWERAPTQYSPASHTSQREDDISLMTGLFHPSVAWDAVPSDAWRD